MTYTLLSCIDSKIIDPIKFYGRFELGTFAPGQGLTVANALRRSLLSELPGTAITLVQITGASHEYETLVGMRECILDLLLNLKQIILTSDFEQFTAQVGFLTVKGPGIVRARDLKLPFFIYCIDPDQYIATLTNEGQLNMKFLINCGKNFLTHNASSSHYFDWVNLLKKEQPINLKTDKNCQNISSSVYKKWQNEIKKHLENDFEITHNKEVPFKKQINSNINNDLINKKNNTNKNSLTSLTKLGLNKKINSKEHNNLSKNSFLQTEKLTNKIGYFPIDAIFAPITRVNYTVESKQDLNSVKETIILEIWTNGTINPRHAIHKAVKSLIQLFLPLQQIKTNIYNKNKFGLKLNKIIEQKDKLNNSLIITPNEFKVNNDVNEKKLSTKLIRLSIKKNLLNSVVAKTAAATLQKKFQDNLKNKRQFDYLTELNKQQKNFWSRSWNDQDQDRDRDLDQNLDQDTNAVFQINSLSKFKILQLDLINLDLSSECYLILKKSNINTIQDLVNISKQQLLNLKNFNQTLLIEVETALQNYVGLSLK